MSIPYELRTDNDRIGEEGFFRSELDRPLGEINDLFVDAFEGTRNPLQASIEAIHSLGGAALLDVGCGTTNTLRTWREELVLQTACSPLAVSLTGISLYDYSRESRFPATEALHGARQVRYLIGDAAEQLRQLPENSIQVAISFNTLMRISNGREVLEQMVRVVAGGGSLFFNLSSLQNMPGSAIRDYFDQLEGKRYEADLRVISASSPKTSNNILWWIQKPQETKNV